MLHLKIAGKSYEIRDLPAFAYHFNKISEDRIVVSAAPVGINADGRKVFFYIYKSYSWVGMVFTVFGYEKTDAHSRSYLMDRVIHFRYGYRKHV